MPDPDVLLEQGRACAQREAWLEAYDALSLARAAREPGAADLETLARAAYMLGRDEEYVAALEAAHRAHLEAGRAPAAARAAFWIGHSLLFRGQGARAAGWFDLGRRLVDESGEDCVERGYLLIPLWLRQMGRGDWEDGFATAAEAAAIGDRFGDADLAWLARDDQARALVKQGRTEEGLGLAGELLVVVCSGALSPVVSGIVYCNTIDFCHDAQEVRHTREWTDALAAWCADRPQMVAHNGLCLVHLAEMLQLEGAWDDAAREAGVAAERFTGGMLNRIATGKAHYRQGEIHRLRGDVDAAEACYRAAGELGCDPLPGLALLNLAQGRVDAAAAAIRRGMVEQVEALQQAALLPAYVEIMLALGDLDAARAACEQFELILRRHRTEALVAAHAHAHARASLDLARDEVEPALRGARRAFEGWADLGAPYDAARARVLVGRACRALGDEESAALELESARTAFAVLGAAPDLAAVEALGTPPRDRHGLSAREVEVLGLLAGGLSNKEIGERLVISEHTVARHLQNIFTKLDVGSRTAASAFAFEHGLARARGRS
ncbi:LuxR C-terminal-related transcriptional regulator [Streptomyces sp. NBC_00879]|uniref:helix-turn-helix transcriptional regulator n=1 Tax=Streptomyces sp. NBC_00879 TaxID=2975855 RepID=UPI00386B0C72|nr:LuxR C-terminal-related transcriptional regulator [Streptomyces sp. NBC_00879]